MELYNHGLSHQSPPNLKPPTLPPPNSSLLPSPAFRRRRYIAGKRRASFVRALSKEAELTAVDGGKLVPVVRPAQPGGRMVAELVGAFNELTERMSMSALSTSSSRILFMTLKLSIPVLQSLPLAPDGRSPLSKALSVAVMLADLQMDAEVISAGILREVWDAHVISIDAVRDRIGSGTAHLLHESLRMKKVPFEIDVLDEESAAALRKYFLTYYDIRAIVLNLVLRLDMMKHLTYLPRYQQQIISLEAMKIHAPLAHAVGANFLSLQLEDLCFTYLFPYSYLYIDTWLRSHETGSKPLIDIYKEELDQALKTDAELAKMVDDVIVIGRYKSRYSTMKKLLQDGRKPEEVNDIMGLRVVLNPKNLGKSDDVGVRACYRTKEIVQLLWKEVPNRTKDYIAKPKANGYMSLHMAVDVSENGRRRPLMEVQIRTAEMDAFAVGGTASHSLYKGGLTDPEEAKRLKTIMMAAAELAALRLKDFPSTNHNDIEIDQRGRVFQLLDKNGDGRISIEELMEVMEELGAQPDDAQEMMGLLDANSDGSLSSDEFDLFQKQVVSMRDIEERDEEYKAALQEKLAVVDTGGLIRLQD